MTDVKRLLEQATPLPWREEAYMDSQNHSFGCDIRAGGPNDYADRVTWGGHEGLDSSVPNHADAALIVHAVNSLPAYEEVVDALEELLTWAEPDGEYGLKRLHEALADARAALSRLRGEK